MKVSWALALSPLLPAALCQVGWVWRPSKWWGRIALIGVVTAMLTALWFGIEWAMSRGLMRSMGLPKTPSPASSDQAMVTIAAAAIGCIWAAGQFALAMVRRKDQAERSTRSHHGDARFARWSDAKFMADQPGFILGAWSKKAETLAAELGADLKAGRGRDGSIMRWAGAGSLLSFSPPGGGKTSSIVIPTLLDYAGPVVTNDPKGENAAVAANARRLLGHRVAILNPFAIKQLGDETDALNVLDFVRYDGSNFANDCLRIAGAIVEKSRSGQSNPHFEESAISIVAGIISFVVDASKRRAWPEGVEPVPASLPGVFDFFTGGATRLEQNFKAIEADNRMIGGRSARQASTTWNQIGSDERGSMYSTIMRRLGSFGDDGIRRASEKSTFDLAGLRDTNAPLDIFICIPAANIQNHKSFLRVVVTAITSYIIDGERPPRDVLLLLDEMAALGPLDALTDASGSGALSLGRSAGLRIWAIVQSLSQLESAYGREGLKLWTGACTVISFMNVGGFDRDTADYISAILGEYTVAVEDSSSNRSARGLEASTASEGRSVRDAGRRLLRLEEVSKLPDDIAICVVTGDGAAVEKRPLLLQKIRYWERTEWAGRYSVNPWHSEPPLSASA